VEPYPFNYRLQTNGIPAQNDTPIGKAPGAGYLEGMGIGNRSVKIFRATVTRWQWPFSIGPVFRAIIRRKYVSQRRSQYEQWATTGFTRVTNRWSCSRGVGQREVCWHSRLASSMEYRRTPLNRS